jgi:hypothetical protein
MQTPAESSSDLRVFFLPWSIVRVQPRNGGKSSLPLARLRQPHGKELQTNPCKAVTNFNDKQL